MGGVAWHDGSQRRAISGRCLGAQSPQRAEVMTALFAVAAGGPSLAELVTDCECIAHGQKALGVGGPEDLP